MKTFLPWFFLVLLFPVSICHGQSQDSNKPDSTVKKAVSGFLIPTGKPIGKPVRTGAGKSCIVDLIQSYSITGDISGSVEMNFRIIVYGKCGSPAGTYDEEWIAYGKFNGTIAGRNVESVISYTAKVKADGDVDGIIIFGQGFDADLTIKGNFSDGKLSYSGKI